MTISSFTLGIDRFLAEDVPEEVGKLARVIAIATLQKVVLKSPVDTGLFRGRWMVTIGERTDAAPGSAKGRSRSKRGAAARGAAAANEALTAGIGVIGGAKPFDTIFVQNNTEYGEKLEDGGSKQAPQGILAVTVAEIEQVFG